VAPSSFRLMAQFSVLEHETNKRDAKCKYKDKNNDPDKVIYLFYDDDDRWRYSPDRALVSLYGFHDSFIVRCGVISSTIDLF
jgi:hypothetical protein